VTLENSRGEEERLAVQGLLGAAHPAVSLAMRSSTPPAAGMRQMPAFLSRSAL
jgi:hypothetical protein